MLGGDAIRGNAMLSGKRGTGSGSAAVGVVLVSVFLAVSGSAQSDAGAIRDRFIGVYALVEYAPHGDEPSGRIQYDRGGHMSAMLFPPGRELLTDSLTAEKYRAAMRGVVAYYGTYDIDVDAGTVTHHVEGASNPAWIGDDFVRWYRFEDGDLRLSLNPDFRGTLLWRPLNSD
jgi:hypothetical protein